MSETFPSSVEASAQPPHEALKEQAKDTIEGELENLDHSEQVNRLLELWREHDVTQEGSRMPEDNSNRYVVRAAVDSLLERGVELDPAAPYIAATTPANSSESYKVRAANDNRPSFQMKQAS